MKAHKNKKVSRELPTPLKTKEPKEKKPWVKEYQWKGLKEFNSYPKHGAWRGNSPVYDQEWHQEWWGAHFKSPKAVEDSIKHELRSSFHKRYIQGRNWRARHRETGEIVDFPDIENYYN